MKIKLNKWYLVKLKKFFTANENINKMKRRSSEWKKIFANETTEKGLIYKIYKKHVWLNIRKTKNQIKKLANDLNRCSSSKDIQMTSRHMKRYSTSLIAREMQIKTIMRYHLILVRMVIIIKISTNNKCWRKENPLALLIRM